MIPIITIKDIHPEHPLISFSEMRDTVGVYLLIGPDSHKNDFVINDGKNVFYLNMYNALDGLRLITSDRYYKRVRYRKVDKKVTVKTHLGDNHYKTEVYS